MNLPIETEDLGKRYGKVIAIKHLSLRVAEGEIYVFLGLNGAGKTTTIRMLLGMIKPTWGTAQVLHTRVRLGILACVIFQWQENIGRVCSSLVLTNVLTDRRFAPLVSLCLNDLKDLVSSITLLARAFLMVMRLSPSSLAS